MDVIRPFDVNGSKGQPTTCCPGHVVPNTLLGTFTGTTGTATQLPSTLEFAREGGYWVGRVSNYLTDLNNQYSTDSPEIWLECSGTTWSIRGGFDNYTLMGDDTHGGDRYHHYAVSQSCNPFQLVFQEAKTGGYPSSNMSYTLTLTEMSPHSLKLLFPYYYEWDSKSRKWYKISDIDPDPPGNLVDGEFDGQIVEVPRES